MTSKVDNGYRLLAAKHLRKQAKQLAGQLDGIRRADDVEHIHRARVASRRLRAALRMFRDCYTPNQVKRWRRQIRRVTTGLGDARDRDVQIEFLSGILYRLGEPHRKTCQPGIARLLVKLERQRERLQRKVLKTIDRLQDSGVLDDMLAVAGQVLADAKSRHVTLQSDYVFRQTERHVLKRLGELLPYRESLADPGDLECHHAMRIAAKSFRYTMELAGPAYKDEMDEHVDAIKWMQSLLGDLHDCDVWLQDLDAFAEKERRRILERFGCAEPFERLSAGIEYLREERRTQRRQAFQALIEHWETLDEQRQWERLTAMLRTGRNLNQVDNLSAADDA